MRFTKITLLFLFISFSSYSQNSEVYFQKIVDTTKNKQLKLASLDSLIKNLQKQKSYKKIADKTEQYIDLAIKMEKYEQAMQFAVNGYDNIERLLNQKKRALKLIEKVDTYVDKTSDSYLIGSLYFKKAYAYYTIKNSEKAIENYTLAIDGFKDTRKDSSYKARAILYRGFEYFDAGDYLKSMKDSQLAALYFNQLGNTSLVLSAFSSIINIYSANGFYEKAIEERDKLIEKMISEKLTDYLYSEYYNQSISYRKINNFAKQEANLLKAYKLTAQAKKDNFIGDEGILHMLSSLSIFYALQSNSTTSKIYLNKAEKIFTKLNTNNTSAYLFLSAKANYFFSRKKYTKANSFATKAYKIAKKANLIEGIMDCEKLLADIYLKIDKNKKSLDYYKSYSKIKDSIFSITKTNALSYYQTLYETERKEKEINKQKASITLLAKENEAKQRLILFGGIGLVLTFLSIYFYKNIKQVEKKRKMQEEFSQKLLLSQEYERKRISKDLHDSLGQSLLLIKNKVSLKSDVKTKELVNNAIEEMRSISRVLHPFQLENIGVSRALENLISQLDENYETIFIFGDIDDIKGILNPNQEVNIFRIVQECISNIIKHAKADSAKITLINTEQSIKIAIKDNGIGFDFSEKYNDFKSLGLKTIKERVRFLKGTLKIDSTKDKGTTFLIQFPKK